MVAFTLSKFGLKTNCIVETVVSTYSSDGSPTAAPMGVLFTAGDRAIIKPFKAEELLDKVKQHLQEQKEAAKYSEKKVEEFVETRARELQAKLDKESA